MEGHQEVITFNEEFNKVTNGGVSAYPEKPRWGKHTSRSPLAPNVCDVSRDNPERHERDFLVKKTKKTVLTKADLNKWRNTLCSCIEISNIRRLSLLAKINLYV